MKIRGITVTGNSRQQAEDAYRAVATGKSVRGYADVDNQFMILCSSESEITPFNPLTGDADMVEASGDLVKQIEFQSESSDVVQQTNYVVCSSGCGAHVISDDIETRFCPACAEALPDDDCPDCDEQSQNQVQASANIEPNIASRQILAAGKTLDEAVDAFRALASAGAEDTRICGDIAVATNLDQDNFRFSPFLGDENIGVGAGVKMDAIASGAEDEQIAAHHFQCMNSECELHVIASTDDTVFCPSCSSGLIEPDDTTADNGTEGQTSLSGDDEDEEDLEDGDDEESEEDESEESDEDESEDEESDDEESEDDESEEEEDLEDGDDDEEEESTSSAATVRTKEPTVTLQRPMLMCVAGAETPAASKLHVAYAGIVAGQKTAVAFYDGVPVAVATAKTAENYADMLDNPKLGQVVASAAGEIGVQPALAQMGFVDIKPQIEVPEVAAQQIEEQVASQVAEIRASATADQKDLSSRFGAALATAGQGINSGFFKDVQNPLITALASALTAIGMQDSEKMVRHVFNEHNDGYLKNLIAKASQIMQYDLAVQNELAEAVSGTVAAKETLPIGKPVTLAPTQQQIQPQHVQQESVSSAGDDYAGKLNLALNSLGRPGR